MKFLANENFPFASIDILRNAGHDVISVGKDFQGITDEEVIEIAINQNRIILTFDRDYGELVFKKKMKPEYGIIYFRWTSFTPKSPGDYLILLFNVREIDFRNKITVIGKDSIRQRKY
jgi:predicted nuclease of predicted toxin-antitoxin system